MCAEKVSSRNVTPMPSMPPSSRRVFVDQSRWRSISAKRVSRTGITRPSGLASSLMAFSRNAPLLRCAGNRGIGQPPQRTPELGQNISGVLKVEQLDGCGIDSLHDPDLECTKEPGHGHPEIVAHRAIGHPEPGRRTAEVPL